VGFFRRQDGTTVEIPDEEIGAAVSAGFTPIAHEDRLGALNTEAAAPDDGGILGAINAGATSFVSGATLGGSDILLGGLMTGGERERLRQQREANAVVSGVANVAGSIAPSLFAGGANLPAGIVSRQAAGITAAGAELGGGMKVAGRVTGRAYEGRAQPAGGASDCRRPAEPSQARTG